MVLNGGFDDVAPYMDADMVDLTNDKWVAHTRQRESKDIESRRQKYLVSKCFDVWTNLCMPRTQVYPCQHAT